jgi:NAD(P)-dependent dehydrogenase (short-subunit alcohol dehydrogenase family)
VAPGVLDGGMAGALPAAIRRSYLAHSGMKRIGRLDEAAALVAFLALENTYLSGQTLALDGGL